MPRFDPETIAALAEGRLSDDEAARLEAAIASDPAALTELELQRAAIAALADAPDLHLTEIERSGMRAAIADELGIVETPTEVVATTRRVPWGAIGVAATALVALVAVVPVVGLLNTSGSDDARTALAPAATTSEADEETAALERNDSLDTDGAMVAEGDSLQAGEEAPGEDLLGLGTTTVPAGAPATQDDTEDAATTTTIVTAETTTSTATTESESFGDMDDLLAELSALWEDPDAVEELATEAIDEDLCWSEDTALRGGEDPGDRWWFEFTDGTQTVVVYFRYGEEGQLGPFAVYEPVECMSVAEIPDAP